MPNDLKLTVDFKPLDKFIDFTRLQAIGIVKRSMRKTVNSQAWITRKFAQRKEIPNSMITRGTFNQRTIRVTPARGRSLTSIVGNVELSGYKGLTNLELGKKEDNVAIPHVKEVRGGNKKKKITRGKRLKNLKPFKRVHKASQLKTLSNSGYKGYFSIKTRSTKLVEGIYKFKGVGKKSSFGRTRGIEWVRETRLKTTKAKRNQWLKRSTFKGTSPGITNREWQRAMDAEFKRVKARFK